MVFLALFLQLWTKNSSLRNEPNFWKLNGMFLVFFQSYQGFQLTGFSQFFKENLAPFPRRNEIESGVHGFSAVRALRQDSSA
jgi:hypothetical protein